MTRTRFFIIAASLLLFFAGNLSSAKETSLISFEVKDQFDEVHTEIEMDGNVVVLFWADRKGSDFNGAWVDAIIDSLRAEPAYGLMRKLEVAHTKGVPFFIKGRVKGAFSKKTEEWVLMDWKGTFNKAYEFESDNCNFLVFDREGQLVHHAFGQDLDEEVLAGTLEATRRLLTAAMETPPEETPPIETPPEETPTEEAPMEETPPEKTP